jgi:hypothetical protein
VDPEPSSDLIPERLAAGFVRWRVTLAAGTERATSADEWMGAFVVIEQGAVEVVCGEGARRTFGRGAFLSLSWLPVVRLRNPGPGEAILVAYRRSGWVDVPLGVPCPS